MFQDNRPGVSVYINSACNASARKNHASVYNYLLRTSSNQYRLYQEGDPCDPSRIDAPTKPNINDIEPEYWWLLDETTNENEIPILFQGFKSENFLIFELPDRTYRQGDPTGKEAQDRWIEFKQFVQMVVNRVEYPISYRPSQWQNSGKLMDYYWGALREKGYETYSTCLNLTITKDRFLINLGFDNSLERKGKAQDSKALYKSWFQSNNLENLPQEERGKFQVWFDDESPITLQDFMNDLELKEKVLHRLETESDAYLDFGRIYSKEEVLQLGMDIVPEAVNLLKDLYPLYKNIVQRATDNLVLIGSSLNFSEYADAYKEMIHIKGAVMYWWSYILREEYQNQLQRNLPTTLYIYGTDSEGHRAITHALIVSEYFTSPGTEGMLSPYQDLTLDEEKELKRAGDTQSQIFKTWLKITKLEELPHPLGLDEFIQYDTKGFINPSTMVNSFIYARKISSEELVKRIINCLSITLETLNFRLKGQQSLEQSLRKGFGFDIPLRNNDPEASAYLSYLSGSRYKKSNKLLLHAVIKCQIPGWQEELRRKGYEVWLKDGKDDVKDFEDQHSITQDQDAFHVKLADIDLDSFSVESFLTPTEKLYLDLNELGYISAPEVVYNPEQDDWEMKSLSEILAAIADSGYIYSEELIINLHNCLNALQDKHFLILTGISGTGKTKFAQIYVNALYGNRGDIHNPFLNIIPVQPQWSDRTGLLGYYNPLTEKYHKPLFLEHLLRAIKDPAHQYFVCLDEMNLAVVEHYFADILSAMESKHKLQLHTSETSIDGVPSFIELPTNFFIIGTVNVDETTHSFSTKVLDRAYTIEFNEVDLDAYLEAYKKTVLTENHPFIEEIGRFCQDINKVLQQNNLHFAYRTVKEILAYMLFNQMSSKSLSQEMALDNMVLQKILPKIRGDERIEGMLLGLRSLLQTELGEEYQPKSLVRINQMIDELKEYGTCQFWR